MRGEDFDRSQVVVEVLEDLEFRYPEAPETRYVVPRGVRLRTGEAGCVLGMSGSGKSTVMTLLAGLRPFSRGRIRYALAGGEAVEVSAADWRRAVGPELWGRIGFAFQRPEMLRSLTAAGNLGLVARTDGTPSLFTEAEWGEVAGSRVWRLSGGQVQRLGLIRAFAAAPRLVFLDEPTNNLDRDNRKEVAEFVRRHRRGRALMVVSHDEAFVESLAIGHRFEVKNQIGGGGRTRTLTPVAAGAAEGGVEVPAARPAPAGAEGGRA